MAIDSRITIEDTDAHLESLATHCGECYRVYSNCACGGFGEHANDRIQTQSITFPVFADTVTIPDDCPF